MFHILSLYSNTKPTQLLYLKAATNSALQQEKAVSQENARAYAADVEELRANLRRKEEELRLAQQDKAVCSEDFANEKLRLEGIISRLERQLSAKQDAVIAIRDDQTSRETLRQQQELIDDLREQLQEVRS